MKKKLRPLKAVFYTLLGVFGARLLYILTPMFELRERSEFLSQAIVILFYVLGISVFVLAIVLIVMTFKAKVKGAQKTFLLLTGFAPAGLVVFSVLHNAFDAFVEMTTGALSAFLGFLSGASFLIAIFAAPAVFIVGIVGSIVHFRKKRK